MPCALVTGATGQVGSYIVERLAAEGWSVRALVRDAAAAAWLASTGVALIQGDVRDPASLMTAANGCDAIFHTAALVTAASWTNYRAVNVIGTQHVVEAAAASGARLLQLSSVAVYGREMRFQDHPTDEETPLRPLADADWYARSKRESEALVLDAHRSGRIWGTAVRPDVIYGRRDRQFVPRIARAMASGFFPVIDGGVSTLAIVHAANVADGAVRAVQCDAAGGKAYNLANESAVTVAEFARLAGQGLKRRVRLVPVPRGVARATLAALAAMLRLTGHASLATHAGSSLDFLARDNPFSSALARRELRWTPPMLPRDGVPDAFAWWNTSRRS
ncbi:MAG: NAD-dependent epimerase/dehydratase family protein [Gemmatimonadaceae bacterium]